MGTMGILVEIWPLRGLGIFSLFPANHPRVCSNNPAPLEPLKELNQEYLIPSPLIFQDFFLFYDGF